MKNTESMKIAELKDRLREALELRNKKAVDLVRDLKIPKSAISQYLSGISQKMDSERLYVVAKYLNVSEPWLIGYDVPKERIIPEETDKKNNVIVDIVARMRTDEDFLSLVVSLSKMDAEKIAAFKQLLSTFLK